MPQSKSRRHLIHVVAPALLGIALTGLSGCGPSEEEKEAALERGRETMANIQEDIIENKSSEVAEVLRGGAVQEMSRGSGDQFSFRKPGRELSREGVVRGVLEQGGTQEQAQAFWEQNSPAVYAEWRTNFGEMSGLSADRLTMLWELGHTLPLDGIEMPQASWPADESGEAMSRRITTGLFKRYGFSDAFAAQQWEQHRDTNRDQFIDHVKEVTGVSAERATELWNTPRG